MTTGNLKNSNLIINLNASIHEAMEKITDNQRGAVVVVDERYYLQGVVSDGDIRRAMLRGATMVTPVAKIVNTNAVTLTKKQVLAKRPDQIFQQESSINILPVIDNHNKVIEVVIRNPEKRRGV